MNNSAAISRIAVAAAALVLATSGLAQARETLPLTRLASHGAGPVTPVKNNWNIYRCHAIGGEWTEVEGWGMGCIMPKGW